MTDYQRESAEELAIEIVKAKASNGENWGALLSAAVAFASSEFGLRREALALLEERALALDAESQK